MKTAVIYARYSSDMQRQESIDAQIRAIEEYCKKNQILIKRTYIDEAQSATTDHRDQFLQMIKDTKELKVDYCIVHKLDRFSRNRYDSAFYKRELKQNGVRVLSVLEQLDDSPESIILESVLEGMSEYYSKNLAREVRKGQKENALAARHNGGTPPLGYDVTPDGKYVINQTEAAAVQKIFDMYCNYYGYAKICDALNREGYRTKRNMPFGRNSIHDILCNEKYTGRYVFNKRASKKTGNRVFKPDSEIIRIDGAMPRIVSDEQWQRAQEIKEAHRHKSRQGSRHFYLLSGKLFCAECGSAYTGSGYTHGRGGARYFQYMCTNRKAKRGCTNKALNSEYIEMAVINEIRSRFNEKFIERMVTEIGEAMQRQNQTRVSSDAVVKDLRSKVEKVKQKINKTWDLYYNDMLPMDKFSQQIDRLNQEQETLNAQLDSVTKKDPSSEWNPKEIRRKLYDVLKTLENSDDGSLREIVDCFVDRIEVSKDDVIIHMNTVPFSQTFGKSRKNLHYCFGGGDEENRTPVRKPLTKAFYECSRCFKISSVIRPKAAG